MPIAPRALLVFALANLGACTLEITDFGETETDSATVSESSSGTSTTDDSTTDDSTTEATTGETSGTTEDAYPACAEYLADTQNVPGDACAEELGCASLSQEECESRFFSNESGTAECRKGALYVGAYSQEDPLCSGSVQEVCVAAGFVGEGGAACEGHYREIEGSVELLQLECGWPISGSYDYCFDVPQEDKPGICGCMPF